MPAGSAPSQTLSHEAPRLSPTSAATRQRTLADVTLDVARSLGPPGNTYFTWMCVLTVVLGAGIVAWTVQTWKGLGMAGLRAPQFWALYITAFVYWMRARPCRHLDLGDPVPVPRALAYVGLSRGEGDDGLRGHDRGAVPDPAPAGSDEVAVRAM